MFASRMPRSCRVMRPRLPKSMIAESDSTKGGETMGSTEITRNMGLNRVFVYMST